jgi:sarcosine oxidase subunit beta
MEIDWLFSLWQDGRVGKGARAVEPSADAVVVGGGTVGAWCAVFLRREGLGRVVLLERERLGAGASSRAAGIVRTQGGSEVAVRLALWTRRFYVSLRDGEGVDAGFVSHPYFLPAFDEAETVAAKERCALQQRLGVRVRWVDAADAESLNPTLATGLVLGGTYGEDDGWVDPPRNILAAAVSLSREGIVVREGVRFEGLEVRGRAVQAVRSSAGRIATPRVVLTGGPEIAAVGRAAGVAIPVGAVRHQVAVTEAHEALAAAVVPMVFDVAHGLYWRPEEGGLLFGMSNPTEPPGVARSIDWDYLEAVRARLGTLVPVTAGLGLRRVWAATIDFTSDHLPVLGPALTGGEPIAGCVVASAGGHGMMWGPAVARVAADLVVRGRSEVVDTSALGLDRFDESGASRLPQDPVALPFPARPGDPGARPGGVDGDRPPAQGSAPARREGGEGRGAGEGMP